VSRAAAKCAGSMRQPSVEINRPPPKMTTIATTQQTARPTPGTSPATTSTDAAGSVKNQA
jgi:hypothetical protein